MATTQTFRKTSLLAGILYLLTFVSVPTLLLYAPLHAADYVSTPEAVNRITFGGLLEIIVALAGIGTAVVLYPVLRSTDRVAAMALVAVRTLEAATIFLGVAAILTAVDLHKNDMVHSPNSAGVFVVLYDKIFIVGQSLLPAVDDLLLGFLLFKSRLVPRWLSWMGMLGAFPLLVTDIALQAGVIDRQSALTGLGAVGVAVFEFVLGLYLSFKGFSKNVVA